MKIKQPLIFSLFLLLSFATNTRARQPGFATIIDSVHYSTVFGEFRNYRVFLPRGYFSNPQKRYPVIYFLHGWSQRYFGSSDHYADFDKGNENNGDNIANFVSTHEVIVVKSDGYNRSADENYYVRPYNIGPVETYRQFPIYYPELIDHVDRHYHTIADREHRAISGLSMGGFMTWWIGGKYPHLFSAAGNFCGSAEFVVGPKAFPVEYRHIDMYKNYGGMKLRLHYGDKDFIRGYHQDLNRIWTHIMDNYEYKMYDAAHSTCGLADMFGFFLETFEHPPAKPQKWDHIDVYPDFSVWDYSITSDRNIPGFTILEDVDKRGFRCSVREFLPDGELLPFVHVFITTAALYERNQLYVINDVDKRTLKTSRYNIRSDNTGRLTIAVNGSVHEIGINRESDHPNICIASIDLHQQPWITSSTDVMISVSLLNKGSSAAKNIQATLSAVKNTTSVPGSKSAFGTIGVNQIKKGQPFTFRIHADSVEVEKLMLTIQDENKNEWVERFELPVKKHVPLLKDVQIADGKIFTVAKSGTDSETILLGAGNGDGIANPGESIVLLVQDQGKYWRTQLTFNDPFINASGINIRVSDNWTSFDHVGASAKYSVPLISADCPENHVTSFFATYWLPEYPYHMIREGTIKIEVKGKDKTTPQIRWVHLSGANVLEARIYDGSKIQNVKATLISKNDPKISFGVELKDDGLSNDKCEGDQVFSTKISEGQFGLYRVLIEALDAHGNTLIEELPQEFIIH